jgi:hypothetical protein
MVYGYRDRVSRRFCKLTRISSSAAINDKANIAIGDGGWIGHYNILDGSGGIVIGDGCQLAARVSTSTHSSQDAIRLLGKTFIQVPNSNRSNYIINRVVLGEYTFIGTGSPKNQMYNHVNKPNRERLVTLLNTMNVDNVWHGPFGLGILILLLLLSEMLRVCRKLRDFEFPFFKEIAGTLFCN